MPDQKLLKAVLRFDIEKQAVKTAEAELATLIKQFQTLQAESLKLERDVADALKKGFDTKDTQSKLTDVKKAMAEVSLAARQHVAESAERSFQKLEQRITRISRMGGDFQQLGMTFNQVSRSIMGPFDEAIRNYTTQMGIADATSRKWVVANRQVEQAQMRVGAVAAAQLLPLMEKGAQLATQVADFVESNPDLVKAILVLGVGTGGLAATAGTIADVMQGIGGFSSALSGLGLLKGAAGAAGTAGAAGAAGVVGTAASAAMLVAAPVIGVIIGEAIVDIMAKNGFGEGGGPETQWLRVKQIAGGATAGSTAMIADLFDEFGNPEVANKIRKNTIEYLKFLGLLTKEGALVGPKIDQPQPGEAPPAKKLMIPESAIKQWINFRRDIEQNEVAYNKQRENMVVNTLRTINEAERNYGNQRAKQIKEFEQGRDEEETQTKFEQNRQRRNFLVTLEKEETKYYSQREEQVTKFNEEESRSLADHQRSLARMARDHQYSMEDAVAGRDAIGALREQRNFTNQVNDSNEDFTTQQAQRKENFDQQLQDQKDSFDDQREGQLENYDKQLADQLEDYNRRRDLAKLHFEQQLVEQEVEHKANIEQTKANAQVELDQQDASYKEQQTLRNAAFQEQLDELAVYLGDESKMRVEYYEQAKKELEAILRGEKALPSGTPRAAARGGGGGDVEERQSGGYMRRGLYSVSETAPEYLLNGSATRLAESLLGGSLTQSSLIQGLSGGSTGRGITYHDARTFTFHGTPNAEEVRRMVRVGTEEALNQAIAEARNSMRR